MPCNPVVSEHIAVVRQNAIEDRQGMRRAHAQPTYGVVYTVRGSPMVSPDETGWKVAGPLQWLWASAPPDTTVYRIELGRRARVPDVQRVAAHLDRELPAMWSFLFDPTIDATNWRAEQALRPAVVPRNVWGGNRSWSGADAQHTRASVIRTALQRRLNPHALLASMPQSQTPLVPLELQSPAGN
jgi:transposase